MTGLDAEALAKLGFVGLLGVVARDATVGLGREGAGDLVLGGDSTDRLEGTVGEDLVTWLHGNAVDDRADGETECASGAVVGDVGEMRLGVEVDGLVAAVVARHVALAAVDARVKVDLRNHLLLDVELGEPGHALKGLTELSRHGPDGARRGRVEHERVGVDVALGGVARARVHGGLGLHGGLLAAQLPLLLVHAEAREVLDTVHGTHAVHLVCLGGCLAVPVVEVGA
mmetsp:Transcript_49425/g.107387  ORF Transcript_49425/g.107387 Transcript_49425/m.107387 type:complete len:228 (+) Transcript_49425:37-720(+)